MSSIVVTLSLPHWFVAYLGNPEPAALERRVLEALVADCVRTGHASNDEARRWLGRDMPGDAGRLLQGPEDLGRRRGGWRWRMT